MRPLNVPMAWNIFDPIGSLAAALHDSLDGLLTGLNRYLATPARPAESDAIVSLYNNALGVAPVISSAVVVVVTCLTLVRLKLISRVVTAFIVALIVGGAAQLWFVICDQGQLVGDKLAEIAMFYDKSNSSLATSFSGKPDQIVVEVINLFFAVGLGWVLVNMTYIYGVAFIIVKFLGLLAFSGSALGQRMRSFMNVLIAIGLVSILFGRASANLAIQVGKLARDVVPGGQSSLGTGFFTLASLLTALALQLILLFICYANVSSVTGKVHSTITGNVNSTIASLKSSAGGPSPSRHLASVRSIPAEPSATPAPSATQKLAHRAATGAAVVTVVASVTGHSKVAASAGAINRFADRFKEKR